MCAESVLSHIHIDSSTLYLCVDSCTKVCILTFQLHCKSKSKLRCSQRGECYLNNDKEVCICHTGYTGVNCETKMEPCTGHNCSIAGYTECQQMNETYICVCKKHYTGKYCENPLAEKLCPNAVDACSFLNESLFYIPLSQTSQFPLTIINSTAIVYADYYVSQSIYFYYKPTRRNSFVRSKCIVIKSKLFITFNKLVFTHNKNATKHIATVEERFNHMTFLQYVNAIVFSSSKCPCKVISFSILNVSNNNCSSVKVVIETEYRQKKIKYFYPPVHLNNETYLLFTTIGSDQQRYSIAKGVILANNPFITIGNVWIRRQLPVAQNSEFKYKFLPFFCTMNPFDLEIVVASTNELPPQTTSDPRAFDGPPKWRLIATSCGINDEHFLMFCRKVETCVITDWKTKFPLLQLAIEYDYDNYFYVNDNEVYVFSHIEGKMTVITKRKQEHNSGIGKRQTSISMIDTVFPK